ncbi:jg930 [Pararge aegeria aegeria]|uniref:Jg930 protein n=1 Tax=Pararge aegeria aegeria TaxID=348720 RepID=A0A8S4RBC0_9NEOP|nr:jg930 [Pararge aegeria aegeria]
MDPVKSDVLCERARFEQYSVRARQCSVSNGDTAPANGPLQGAAGPKRQKNVGFGTPQIKRRPLVDMTMMIIGVERRGVYESWATQGLVGHGAVHRDRSCVAAGHQRHNLSWTQKSRLETTI